MYDTVNLWLPIDRVESCDISNTIQHLSNLTEHKKMMDKSILVEL